MFGYVVANNQELKVKELEEYKAYYCGLCNALKKKHGVKGQVTLNYDCVFLAILLTALYEPETKETKIACALHPSKRRSVLKNDIIEYIADIDIMLAYHNLKDAWQDERNILKWIGASVLKKDYKRLAKKYPRQHSTLVSYMEQINICQNEDSTNLDLAAKLSGIAMGEMFIYKEDEWSEILRKIGYYLGKFIYLMDAYDDLEDDIKNKQYNVLKHYMQQEDFHEMCEKILAQMMSACAHEFEKLPILLDIGILRNIIYAGVWTRFDQIRKKREKSHEDEKRHERILK